MIRYRRRSDDNFADHRQANGKRKTTKPRNHMNTTQHAHPAAVRSRQRQHQAVEPRKGGATYLEIGEALGVNKSRAYAIVMAAMDERGTITGEGAAQVKQMELERL